MSDLVIEIPESFASDVPSGIYVVKLIEVVPAISKFTDEQGRPKQQFRWVFEVVRVIDADLDEAEDAVGSRIYSYTSTSFAPRARARAYLEALLGREVEPREKVAVTSLVGKLARATVKVVDGRPRIDSLAPYRRSEPAPF